jgi:antitoxin protein of toxin-antitoxin system
MALADRLKSLFKQGQGAVAANPDKAHQAVDKVAAEADKRTHGKYGDQIHTAEQKAGEAVDKMGDQGGTGTTADPGRRPAADDAGAPPA